MAEVVDDDDPVDVWMTYRDDNSQLIRMTMGEFRRMCERIDRDVRKGVVRRSALCSGCFQPMTCGQERRHGLCGGEMIMHKEPKRKGKGKGKRGSSQAGAPEESLFDHDWGN